MLADIQLANLTKPSRLDRLLGCLRGRLRPAVPLAGSRPMKILLHRSKHRIAVRLEKLVDQARDFAQ